MEKGRYINVILPLAVSKLYTYAIPSSLEGRVKKGTRVLVQFGARKIYSAIVAGFQDSPPPAHEVKEIMMVLDETPIINEYQLSLWNWMAKYYMCTPGEIMKAALPAGLKLESETRISLNPGNDSNEQFTEKESLLLELITNEELVPIKKLAGLSGQKNIISLVNDLLSKGVILVE